jgi:hypothetical protein
MDRRGLDHHFQAPVVSGSAGIYPPICEIRVICGLKTAARFLSRFKLYRAELCKIKFAKLAQVLYCQFAD